ncbi:hypothetical protein BTHI11S_01433 [Bosea thiooxidans]
MPAPIVARINTELNKVLKQPDTRSKLRSAGAEALGGSSEEFGALIKSDVPKWTAVIKAADVKVADEPMGRDAAAVLRRLPGLASAVPARGSRKPCRAACRRRRHGWANQS